MLVVESVGVNHQSLALAHSMPTHLAHRLPMADMATRPSRAFWPGPAFPTMASEVPQGSPALVCQKSRMAWVASKWEATGGLPTVVGPGQLWPPLMTVA
jgi:hypothetical protein